MNRKINLIYDDKEDKVDQLENIPISELERIFPYSCEILVCKYFNIFEEKQSLQALSVLLDKIRPQGQLIIGVIDLTKICDDFLNKKITTSDFFSNIKYCHNAMGLDDIMDYTNKNSNFSILEIVDHNNYIYFITLTKKQ